MATSRLELRIAGLTASELFLSFGAAAVVSESSLTRCHQSRHHHHHHHQSHRYQSHRHNHHHHQTHRHLSHHHVCQVILGSSVRNHIRSFGFSLSGGVDLDNNE